MAHLPDEELEQFMRQGIEVSGSSRRFPTVQFDRRESDARPRIDASSSQQLSMIEDIFELTPEEVRITLNSLPRSIDRRPDRSSSPFLSSGRSSPSSGRSSPSDEESSPSSEEGMIDRIFFEAARRSDVVFRLCLETHPELFRHFFDHWFENKTTILLDFLNAALDRRQSSDRRETQSTDRSRSPATRAARVFLDSLPLESREKWIAAFIERAGPEATRIASLYSAPGDRSILNDDEIRLQFVRTVGVVLRSAVVRRFDPNTLTDRRGDVHQGSGGVYDDWGFHRENLVARLFEETTGRTSGLSIDLPRIELDRSIVGLNDYFNRYLTPGDAFVELRTIVEKIVPNDSVHRIVDEFIRPSFDAFVADPIIRALIDRVHSLDRIVDYVEANGGWPKPYTSLDDDQLDAPSSDDARKVVQESAPSNETAVRFVGEFFIFSLEIKDNAAAAAYDPLKAIVAALLSTTTSTEEMHSSTADTPTTTADLPSSADLSSRRSSRRFGPREWYETTRGIIDYEMHRFQNRFVRSDAEDHFVIEKRVFEKAASMIDETEVRRFPSWPLPPIEDRYRSDVEALLVTHLAYIIDLVTPVLFRTAIVCANGTVLRSGDSRSDELVSRVSVPCIEDIRKDGPVTRWYLAQLIDERDASSHRRDGMSRRAVLYPNLAVVPFEDELS